MELFGIDFDRNNPDFPGKDNRSLGNNGIIPFGIDSEKFYNMCSEHIFYMWLFLM